MSGLTRDQFRRAFEGNRDQVFRFLYRLSRNAADADDLLQETFLTVWNKRDQFEGRGSLEGYLRRTAYRTFLNHRERTGRRARLAPSAGSLDAGRLPEPPDPRPAESLDDADARRFLLALVRRELDGMPEAQRDAFVLFRYEGMTCPEIAEATDTPVKTVETRVRRATAALAGRLERYRSYLPAGRP